MQRAHLLPRLMLAPCLVSYAVSCQKQNSSHAQVNVGIRINNETSAGDLAQRVPSEADWRSEPWALDGGETIYKAFAGKSREEASEVFATRPWAAQSYLQDMPSTCFRFYVRSFLDYMQSSQARGDSSAACNFTQIAAVMAHGNLPVDDYALKAVGEILEKIVATRDWYGLEASDYQVIVDEAKNTLHRVNVRKQGGSKARLH